MLEIEEEEYLADLVFQVFAIQMLRFAIHKEKLVLTAGLEDLH